MNLFTLCHIHLCPPVFIGLSFIYLLIYLLIYLPLTLIGHWQALYVLAYYIAKDANKCTRVRVKKKIKEKEKQDY